MSRTAELHAEITEGLSGDEGVSDAEMQEAMQPVVAETQPADVTHDGECDRAQPYRFVGGAN